MAGKTGHAHRRIKAWLLGVVVVAGCIFAARGPLPLVESWWQAGGTIWNDRSNRRHRMADWLVWSRSLVGKTRAQVIEELGEPTPTSFFSDWSLVYLLGAERDILSIDSEWLVVRIGDDGRVAEARIVRD